MKQDTKSHAIELFTITEVMGKLKISRPTLWRLTKEKGIKTVKVGGSIRYTPDGVSKLIQAN